MGNARTAGRALATLTALALLTGCVPGLVPERDRPPADPVSHGQLSAEQLGAVLPTEEQLPEGFSIEEGAEGQDSDAGPDPEATAYPATCLDVRLGGTSGTDLASHKVAGATRSFVGDEGGTLSVKVSTHDLPVPGKLFDDAGAAQSQCGTFQLIDNGGVTTWKLARVAFPQLGDRTYATRVESTTEGDIFKGGVVQLAAVSLGHNLVYIVYSAGPASRYDPTAVETFAQATVDNLAAL